MLDPKFAILGGILDLFGTVTYAVATWRGTAKPNRVSWVLWTITAFIAFAAQLGQGVTYQAALTFVAGFGPLLVFLVSFKHRQGYWRISRLDYACGALSVLAIILWIITKTGNIAIALSIAADCLASIPTIVKAYRHPGTESAGAFIAGVIAAAITLLTIKNWAFAGYGFAVYVLLDCLVIAALVQFPRLRPRPAARRVNGLMTKLTAPPARLVTVTATDGLMLPALLFEPAKPTKRLMVWLHGMGSSGIFYGVDHTNALAAATGAAGVAFFGLQNRGGGMLQGVKYLDDNDDKQKRLQGTTHELIADCVHDINGAVEFARAHGYTELYLGGHSTGANKTALYSYLKPKNPFTGYVLYGGGDDTGISYEEMGDQHYRNVLAEARRQTAGGHGADLAPLSAMQDYFSYQSIADILDPDGGYNTFPYYESQHDRLGVKPLWREFKSITKPTLVVYGAADEYCRPSVAACVDLLKREAPSGIKFTYKLIPGGDHSCYRHEPELAATIATWLATSTR